MKIKLAKLGSMTSDTATGMLGMLTHMNIGLDRTPVYIFQPNAISKETGHPVASFWLAAGRLECTLLVDVDLPLEVLGTEVRDNASGFRGMAIGVTMHINGCVHIEIQAEGTKKTGDKIDLLELDIRRLSGEAIKKMTEAEQADDEKQNPSPAPMPTRPHS